MLSNMGLRIYTPFRSLPVRVVAYLRLLFTNLTKAIKHQSLDAGYAISLCAGCRHHDSLGEIINSAINGIGVSHTQDYKPDGM